MKQYRELGQSGNCIITIAIGNNYREKWETYSFPSWKKYCDKYDLGLFVVTSDLIPNEHKKWKKATWQKLLLGVALQSCQPHATNVCYLDTDILINPHAPNIFDTYDGFSYGLVSKVKNLPMPLELVLRQFVFLRNYYYDQSYPLDSVVFMPVEQQYKFSNLAPLDDAACAGLILFNVDRSAAEMEEWFHKYDASVQSITGGDQIHVTWEMMNSRKVQWLPYQFQALWVYEMAWKYWFLYDNRYATNAMINCCVNASLFSNYFLHFAGSWFESDMWCQWDTEVANNFHSMNAHFNAYLEKPVAGMSLGKIKPSDAKAKKNI